MKTQHQEDLAPSLKAVPCKIQPGPCLVHLHHNVAPVLMVQCVGILGLFSMSDRAGVSPAEQMHIN